MLHPLVYQYPMSNEELIELENNRVNLCRDIVEALSQPAIREKRCKMEGREVKLGSHVIWHESDGTACDAIVTAVWSQTCINVVIVSPDASKQDTYGRQIERRTSCTYKTLQNVHGFYWRFPEEEPNKYIPPQAV